MGNNTSSIVSYYVSYEDVQNIINSKRCILLNTLHTEEQTCLIQNTLSANEEVNCMNKIINNLNYDKIYIYGKNYMDVSTNKKYEQLLSLGLKNVYIYGGGLFEWLLLQDIYGDDSFPTTSKDLDILKYRPIRLNTQSTIEH